MILVRLSSWCGFCPSVGAPVGKIVFWSQSVTADVRTHLVRVTPAEHQHVKVPTCTAHPLCSLMRVEGEKCIYRNGMYHKTEKNVQILFCSGGGTGYIPRSKLKWQYSKINDQIKQSSVGVHTKHAVWPVSLSTRQWQQGFDRRLSPSTAGQILHCITIATHCVSRKSTYSNFGMEKGKRN